MNWELIWSTVLWGLLSAFALMSVLVTINGARDVKRLLAGLKKGQDDATP